MNGKVLVGDEEVAEVEADFQTFDFESMRARREVPDREEIEIERINGELQDARLNQRYLDRCGEDAVIQDLRDYFTFNIVDQGDELLVFPARITDEVGRRDDLEEELVGKSFSGLVQ